MRCSACFVNVANAYASITAANIDDIIITIYSVIPAELLGKPDLFIAMGTDTFRLYRQWLVNANLYHYPANEVAEMEIIDPSTGIKIYGLHGMNGTNKIVAGLWSNFFLGTDMMNEEEEFEFIFNPFERRVQFHTAFKYGCQVAYPEQVVLQTLPHLLASHLARFQPSTLGYLVAFNLPRLPCRIRS